MAALTFPVSAAQFWTAQRVLDLEWSLSESVEVSTDGNGEVLVAQLGVRLWRASVTIARAPHAVQAQTLAMAALLRHSGASFMAYPTAQQYPAADPTGSILGAATPLLASIAGDNRVIGISGLPSAYQISAGDFLSFSYGSAPIRYALHQVVVGAAASGAGLASGIEVTPPVRPGATVGAAIKLVRPEMKAIISPGSASGSVANLVRSEAWSYSLQQTLR